MLSRIKFTIEPLVAEMLNQLPKSMWTSDTTTFFDPAIGGGQFVRAIEQRLRAAGHSDANIHDRVFGFEESELHIRFAVNKYKLVGQYVKMPYNKLFELDNSMKFDVIIGNPPYTDGQKLLYTKFFEQALDIAELVAFVMPVQLDSNHDKLKFHNHRVQKHLLNLSDNMSHHFNVGYDTIRCVYAQKSIENEVKEYKDPVSDIPLLYPNRERLVPIKGDTDIAIGEDVAGGVDTIFKVHKGDNVRYKKVEQYKIDKTTKKSTANFLVLVNHTPSKGRFNCAILPNIGQSWSMWTFAFECDTIESATKLKDWLQSETIINEISKMLKARNNQHTISKALIEKLPTYE